ncbi:MAG: hypothetical protein KC620_14420, partial [Myxococcales bacterium]|nr:hypothetical protein [Myxococcales bacterium]
TETQTVDFERGFFTVYLGDVNPVQPALFQANQTVWLGIAVDGDEEMDPVALGTAPFAGFAQYTGEAATAAFADSAATA